MNTRIRASLLFMNEGVVSKETVVLRRWGSSIQKFGFINGVDNVNWPPYRDSKLLESLYGGQFTLSTPLIKPNHYYSCIELQCMQTILLFVMQGKVLLPYL